MAAEFVRAVAEVCQFLGIGESVATVGVSFGGLQAVEVAATLPRLAPRLVLHSCAPSSLPYPDTALEAVAGPMVFGAHSQRLAWPAVRALTASDRGLRLMMSSLSTETPASWWESWTPADRASARETFASMASGSGFVTDLRQGRADRSHYREVCFAQSPVPRWSRPPVTTAASASHTPRTSNARSPWLGCSRRRHTATSTGSVPSGRTW